MENEAGKGIMNWVFRALFRSLQYIHTTSQSHTRDAHFGGDAGFFSQIPTTYLASVQTKPNEPYFPPSTSLL